MHHDISKEIYTGSRFKVLSFARSPQGLVPGYDLRYCTIPQNQLNGVGKPTLRCKPWAL